MLKRKPFSSCIGPQAAVVAVGVSPAIVSGVGSLSPRSWTNDRTASTYDPPLPNDNDDDSDDGSASAETLRDEHPKRHHDCITSNVSVSQTREREHDRAVSGASPGGGRGAIRWAKTLGWADRPRASSRFLQSSSPEKGGGRRAGGRAGAAAGGGRLSVTAPTVLESKMSAASLRNCDLGRDPREAAKLMSKKSFFVKV